LLGWLFLGVGGRQDGHRGQRRSQQVVHEPPPILVTLHKETSPNRVSI
jgi:hypothetical protein